MPSDAALLRTAAPPATAHVDELGTTSPVVDEPPTSGAATPLLGDRPDLEQRYEDEVQTVLAGRLRLVCWLVLALLPPFAALEACFDPVLFMRFLPIRLTTLTFVVLVLLALQTVRGRHRASQLSFVTLTQVGLAIAVIAVDHGGGSSPYYAGITLVMLGAAVLLPLDAGRSATCVLVLIGGYVGLCLGWAGVGDVAVFAGNVFFLTATGIIMVASHTLAAALRRRDFLQRVALEEAGRHRDEFLANITHELRTPLAAILGYCEMLDDFAQHSSDDAEWLGRIRQNAMTLYRLIVQLLDFSKLEAGAMHLASERLDLAGIIHTIATDMRAIAGANGVEVGVEIAPDLPVVTGDAARVEEIVRNLAVNALKFAAGEPITLGLRASTLGPGSFWQRIVPDPDPDAAGTSYAEITVTDRGVGMRAEDLRRLFVAFQQLDGSMTRRQGGTGLGLAISARFAAAMRGYISVRTLPGHGSTFALLLPVANSPTVSAGTRGIGARRERPAASRGAQRSGAEPAAAVLSPGRAGIMRSSGPP